MGDRPCRQRQINFNTPSFHGISFSQHHHMPRILTRQQKNPSLALATFVHKL